MWREYTTQVAGNMEQEDKSRSQIKREYRELKELAKRLTDLSPGQLQNLPLSDTTRDGLLAAKEMTRSALQRQFRYLASLLAEEDADAVKTALAGELLPHAREVSALHEAERWRDRLLAEEAFPSGELLERFPDIDLAHVRRLASNAKREQDLGKPPRSARLLFRYLRELIPTEE
jgi:ribosome-associated protein